jgi:hypothetical protein
MSGTATTDLTAAQATAILQAVYNSLQIVLASPLRTKPGQVINASLVPAAPLLDVSDLANGILNIALTSKDVLYQNAQATPVPDPAAPGQFGGDVLAGTAKALGGQPFPPPLGTVGGSAAATNTNIPGLLAQIFGTLAIPQLKVRIRIKWIVRRKGQALQEATDFLAPQGITGPNLSLLLPPPTYEMRLDTIMFPRMEVACLSAQVTLTLGSNALPALEVPPVPVLLLPLLIPTVVAMFSEPNFGVLNPTLTLVVVPLHSPLGSLRHVVDTLNKVQDVVDALSGLAQFAGWILGLNELIGALTDQPRVRFINQDKIDSFDDVSIKPGPLFGFLGDDNFDDVANSILMLGIPGAKAWFYNDDNQTTGGDQGYYALRVLNDSLFVMVRDLKQTNASSDPPAPYPYYYLPQTDWHADSYGSPTWSGSMSSFQFDPAWLADMRADATNIGGLPDLRCVRARPQPTGSIQRSSTGKSSKKRVSSRQRSRNRK